MITAYYGPFSFPRENTAVGDFVSREIWGQPDCFETFCTMGVFDEGKLIAGVVYHNWHPDAGVMELSVGGDKWVSRRVLQAMFYLPFSMLGARLVVWRVSERDDYIRSMAKRLGFKETLIPQLRADDEAECVCTLSAADWASHKINR